MQTTPHRTLRWLTALVAVVAALLAAAGTAAAEARPEDLQGIEIVTGVAGVSAGGTHSCAVTTNHQVLCWGDGSSGQLGVGELSGPSPARLVLNRAGTGPLTGVAAVATGYSHSCALLTVGEVRCWGDGGF